MKSKTVTRYFIATPGMSETGGGWVISSCDIGFATPQEAKDAANETPFAIVKRSEQIVYTSEI